MSSEAMQLRDTVARYVAGAHDVPPGYKRTEVGIIPEDWKTHRLGELGHIVRGGSPRPAGDPRFFNGAFIPWLTVAVLTNLPEHATYVSETFSHLTEEGAKRSRKLSPGTLIIANSGATLGIAKILDLECCANDGIAAIINQQSGDKPFLCYYINKQTDRLRDVVATGNGQPNLNTTLIAGIPVPFPEPTEQRAIADVLSDVDGLLGTLEALIAKKRAIKQAAMQQLLTGKTRLPGFIGEWETKRVWEIGRTYGGLSGKSKSDFGIGHARYVTFLNVLENVVIDPKRHEAVRVMPGEVQNCVHRGDVLLNGTSETPGDLAMAAAAGIDEEDLYLNSFCFGFRLHDRSEHLPLFLAYYFRGSPGRQIMYALAQGATRYNISKSQFMALMLSLPRLEEQKAIATVLSDMDAEIAALEVRREKTRAIKRGMIQQLLTGKVRLVNPEAA